MAELDELDNREKDRQARLALAKQGMALDEQQFAASMEHNRVVAQQQAQDFKNRQTALRQQQQSDQALGEANVARWQSQDVRKNTAYGPGGPDESMLGEYDVIGRNLSKFTPDMQNDVMSDWDKRARESGSQQYRQQGARGIARLLASEEFKAIAWDPQGSAIIQELQSLGQNLQGGQGDPQKIYQRTNQLTQDAVEMLALDQGRADANSLAESAIGRLDATGENGWKGGTSLRLLQAVAKMARSPEALQRIVSDMNAVIRNPSKEITAEDMTEYQRESVNVRREDIQNRGVPGRSALFESLLKTNDEQGVPYADNPAKAWAKSGELTGKANEPAAKAGEKEIRAFSSEWLGKNKNASDEAYKKAILAKFPQLGG